MDEGLAMSKWAYYGISSLEDERIVIIQQIEFIEQELKKRIEEESFAPWGRKQGNLWDKKTNFIYKMSSWEDFKFKTQDYSEALRNYALNRWFNFWSAKGVESIFCSVADVEANLNQYDKLIDFTIKDTSFDHKTTVFPRQYPYSLEYAMNDPQSLILWLYENQSRQQRYHNGNRLFIVLYAVNNEHWKLRAELRLLYQLIVDYVATFDSSELIKLDLQNNQVYSDIIWLKT